MSNERTLLVFAIGLLIMCATCLLLYICRARAIFYYLTVPPILFGSSYAFTWAYGITNPDVPL
jgi:hypothetical protein